MRHLPFAFFTSRQPALYGLGDGLTRPNRCNLSNCRRSSSFGSDSFCEGVPTMDCLSNRGVFDDLHQVDTEVGLHTPLSPSRRGPPTCVINSAVCVERGQARHHCHHWLASCKFDRPALKPDRVVRSRGRSGMGSKRTKTMGRRHNDSVD